jgi:cardiolipin synthase
MEEANLYQKTLKEQRRAIRYGTYDFIDKNAAKHQDMILFHNKLSGSLYTQNNDVTIYTLGKDKFKDLFNDIIEATCHIHVLYYIINNDDLGNKLLNLLENRSKAGIEVRLLIDHFGSRSIPKKRLKQLKRNGVNVAFFFITQVLVAVIGQKSLGSGALAVEPAAEVSASVATSSNGSAGSIGGVGTISF